jgi:hypothetical protein
MGRRPKPPPPPPPPPAPPPPPTPMARRPIKQAEQKTQVRSPQQVVKQMFRTKRGKDAVAKVFAGLGKGLF